MKRYYSGEKSAPAWVVRPFLVIAFPFIMVWCVVDVFFREMWSGLRRTWLEIFIVIEEFVAYWKKAR